MSDSKKNKTQLMNELAELRQRLAEQEEERAKLEARLQSLEESEERFRLLLLHSRDGINICERILVESGSKRHWISVIRTGSLLI